MFAFAIVAVLYKDCMMFIPYTDEYKIEKQRLILSGNTYTIVLAKLTERFPEHMSQIHHVAALEVKQQAIHSLGQSTLAHTYNQLQDETDEGM